MREILFRGKREDGGGWVEGSYCQNTQSISQPIIAGWVDGDVVHSVSWVRVIPETVGEYIGIKNKNGVKIFEGDVLSRGEVNDDREHFQFGRRYLYKVEYEQVGFVAEGIGFGYKEFVCRDHEVIGNIHDNPELMNGGTDE